MFKSNANINHNRRSFIQQTGLGMAALSSPSLFPLQSNSAHHNKPNVILIMTDDQGYGDIGAHGNDVIETPHLDKLHAQSTRLTNFHVSPTCSPSRASLMTGRYNNRTGVWHTIMGRSMLRKDEVTIAEVFGSQGYQTGIFGKWHLGDNYPCRPQDKGFQEVLIHGGGGVGQAPDYWGNDYTDDTYFQNGKPKKFQGYCTDVFFDGAMKFIESNKEQPFFCYLPTNVPHTPYNVDESYVQHYLDKGLNRTMARFYGMLHNFDENMGRLLKKLDDLDLAENTIVVFMTDNGTSGKGFNNAMRGTKGSEYDGGHRVPCFVRWPAGNISSGLEINQITAHIDILPTLVDLTGLKKPDGLHWDGDSLVPLLTRKKNWQERTLVVDSQRIEYPEKWRKSAVMTDRWRLVNGNELYDMYADPSQKNNLAKQFPDEVKKLSNEYEKWWASISERYDDYTEIILGSDIEPETTLSSHDWHEPTGEVPWHQLHIFRGLETNGFWAIDVSQAGEFEFSLRRWPKESNLAILDLIDAENEPGKPISVKEAKIKIGGVEKTKPVSKDDKAAAFRLHIPSGKTRLQTWFIGDNESRGAYYVDVKRL